MRRVNQLAAQNWAAFAQEESTELAGHLVQFPYQVSKEGVMSALAGADPLFAIGESIQGRTYKRIPPMFTV